MPTLILLYKFRPEHIEQIREAAPGWTIVTGPIAQIDKQVLQDAEVIVGWHPSIAESLEAGSKLKWLQTISAGIDKLPLDKLEQNGVWLTSASGIHPISMAETFFGMLLAFTRNLHLAIRNQTQRTWQTATNYEQLTGKTISIIGVGAIGIEIARLANAFGMRVIGIRRSGEPVTGVDQMYTLESLDDVLSQSDVTINVLPYMEQTHHLFNAERFKFMRPSSLFFNLGRGASVNTNDLVEALQLGIIGGAGLDVFETEPLPSDHPLWGMDNVILTPHIGGWTDNYKQKMADLFIPNLLAYLASGKPSTNVVDYETRY